jgi:hypothetical protein
LAYLAVHFYSPGSHGFVIADGGEFLDRTGSANRAGAAMFDIAHHPQIGGQHFRK